MPVTVRVADLVTSPKRPGWTGEVLAVPDGQGAVPVRWRSASGSAVSTRENAADLVLTSSARPPYLMSE